MLIACSRPSIQVTGTILGADGQPPALAHVHMTSLSGTINSPQKTVQANEDGAFTVRLDQPGAYYLQITAVEHEIAILLVVLNEKESPIDVSVTLAPRPYMDTFDQVSIIGDWNEFDWDAAESMTRQPDGTFLYERETTAETLTYQLLHITMTNRSVNGTMSDSFGYDGDGGYWSVIKVQEGVARIVFDPEQLLRIDDPALPRIAFDEGHTHLSRLTDIQQEVERFEQEAQEARMAYYQEHQNYEGFEFDISPLSSRLKVVIESEDSLLVRQYAAVNLLEAHLSLGLPPTPDTMADVLQLVPPSSLLWGIEPYLPQMTSELDPDHPDSLVRAFVTENPDHHVKGLSLSFLMEWAHSNEQQEEFNRIYAQLKKDYSDIWMVQNDLKIYNPDRRVIVGKPIPDFKVQLMGSDEVVSNESLKGHTYFLNFWATW
jgi:hypothetical protein